MPMKKEAANGAAIRGDVIPLKKEVRPSLRNMTRQHSNRRRLRTCMRTLRVSRGWPAKTEPIPPRLPPIRLVRRCWKLWLEVDWEVDMMLRDSI